MSAATEAAAKALHSKLINQAYKVTDGVSEPTAIYLGREEYIMLLMFFEPPLREVKDGRVTFEGLPVFEVDLPNHVRVC